MWPRAKMDLAWCTKNTVESTHFKPQRYSKHYQALICGLHDKVLLGFRCRVSLQAISDSQYDYRHSPSQNDGKAIGNCLGTNAAHGYV